MDRGMTFPAGNRWVWSALSAVLVAVMVVTPSTARCALGDTLEAVQSEGAAAHAVVRAQQMAAYSVHSLSLPAGTQVNEYADSSGHIFAVTWRGPVIPDLSQWLGAYYLDYNAARPAANMRTGHRFLAVHTARVVVTMAGQQRDLWGRAYLPNALPPNVSIAEVR
jgi:hypothetical protein